MTEFWFLSLGLLLLALMFVFVPVISFVKKVKKTNAQVSDDEDLANDLRQRHNVLIFKERLAELENEFAQGKLVEEMYLQLKSELEASLLIDVERVAEEGVEPISNKNSSVKLGVGNIAVLGLSAIFVIVVSYGSYFKGGAYEDVLKLEAMAFDSQEIEQARTAAKNGDMSALLSQLYDKLKQAPDNIEGWTLLARSAMNTEHYDLASEAYHQIIRLVEADNGNSASVYGLLAQTYFYQNNEKINTDVQTALDRAFEQNPNEINSLGLMAINAYMADELATAIEYWEKILTASPDHPARISIETGIARAQATLGITVDFVSADKANKSAAIRVEVSIASEVLAKVNAEDTVFIFASAASGSGPSMPLAAGRYKVSEFPLSVVLNDDSAMGPMAKLSQVSHADVVARISRSGQPVAQAGDFEGRHKSVDVYSNDTVQIQISNAL